MPLKDGHMDDCYTLFMALAEESKSARVIRKCSSVLNRFLKYAFLRPSSNCDFDL